MERIMYRKTLDVHKNGIQFILQGFETADNMSRVIEISLMASGDAIDFPLENVEAIMYVNTPSASSPSINKCTIKDNKIVYEALPIVEEGITTMQLKIIETSVDGPTSILASPKFAVEVTKSETDDSEAVQSTSYTALEKALAQAKAVYDGRVVKMELTSDCLFRVYYADGILYESDVLRTLFLNGNVLLSESFAHGGTGLRVGEETDNSMYYSNVSKSESLKAKNLMENSEELLEQAKLQGVYTAFSVNFETGEVEYVSPCYQFKVNMETGNLDAIGQAYTFLEEIGRVTTEWLDSQGYFLSELKSTSARHTEEITALQTLTDTHIEQITNLQSDLGDLEKRVTPVELGGTGATTAEGAIYNIIGKWNLDNNLGKINAVDGEWGISLNRKSVVNVHEYSIPMIHTGNVRLSLYFKPEDKDSYNGQINHTETSLVVYVDDEVRHTVPGDTLNTYSRRLTFDTEVAKGEILKLVLKSKGKSSSSSTMEKVSATAIRLIANIDTPYKYVDLNATTNDYTIE